MTTTNYQIAQIIEGQGQQSITVNTAFDTIDRALAGYLIKSVAGNVNVTLTALEWSYKLFEFTGTLTGNIAVIVPNLSRLFVVYNHTSGAYSLTVRTAAGVGYLVPQGSRVVLECDTADVFQLTAGGGGSSGAGTANYAMTFTAQTTVTVLGTTHNLSTANILHAVYDNASPRARIQEGTLTVDDGTYNVVVTFGVATTGKLVLSGSGPGSAGYSATFVATANTPVTISGSVHSLGTANIVPEFYDNASPRNAIQPATVTVDDTSFDVVFVFGVNTTGKVVLNGAGGAAGGGGGGALNNPVLPSQGGTGASTLTGVVLGHGASTMTAVTTSAGLAAALSDEVGTGFLVLNDSPTFTTLITDPLLIGGTGTTSALRLRSTSGAGAAGADIIFQTGTNGGTEAMRILNSAFIGIGVAAPLSKVHIQDAADIEVRLSSSAVHQTERVSFYDTTTPIGRVFYAGANASSNRWFGLVSDGADYVLLGSLNNVPTQMWVNSLEVARFGSTGLLMATTVDVTIPNIKSTTGQNYVAIDTTGKLVSSPIQLTPRIVTLTDAVSLTPSFGTADQNNQVNTQAAGTLTFNAPSGSPADGKTLVVVVIATNAQTLAFNAIYRGSTDLPLPTTMPAGTNYFIFAYRSTPNKYDLLSKVFGY